MPGDKAVIGARLREEREARRWSRIAMASRMRAASDEPLPADESLTHMIKEWEAGKHGVSDRYRALITAVFGVDEQILFGVDQAATWPDIDLNGWAAAEDVERAAFAAAGKSSRIDAGAVGALSAILAGQRRLEDAIGPAALIDAAVGQARGIAGVLRETTGPHRDALGRVVSEWMTFTGWLHAATRQDARALALFDLAENLADDVDYGTGAALATSFRGYVARQQNRPRAVVRAAAAALATPGTHQTQRTFDTLQAAQGYAALGEIEQARRMLDQAADLSDDAEEPPAPVYWYTRPFFQLNIGLVQAGIGEHRDAAAVLGEGLAGMPADQRGAEWLREYEDAFADAKDRA